MKAKTGCEMLIEVGEWCVTKDHSWGNKGDVGIYADHIKGCVSEDEPIELGDCCWAADDKAEDKQGRKVCFYCNEPVPPEIQALVHLQVTL